MRESLKAITPTVGGQFAANSFAGMNHLVFVRTAAYCGALAGTIRTRTETVVASELHSPSRVVAWFESLRKGDFASLQLKEYKERVAAR